MDHIIKFIFIPFLLSFFCISPLLSIDFGNGGLAIELSTILSKFHNILRRPLYRSAETLVRHKEKVLVG